MVIHHLQSVKVLLVLEFRPVHRGAFCQFPFRWIYYYGSNKSTGKKTGKTHLCAVIVTFRTVTTKQKIIAAVLVRLVAFFLFAVVLPLNAKMANNDMLTA